VLPLSQVKEQRIQSLQGQVFFVLLFGLTLFLCTHNLETYPRPWWDEGKFVQIPRNIVLHGKYATLSSEGFRMFSVYGTGPAVFLPMAVVFKLLGVGLLQARLVMTGFTLVAVVAFYSVAKLLYDKQVALVAAFLLVFVVFDQFTSLLFLGRQVLGEIPAFCYLMIGCLIWMKQRHDATWFALVLSGIFWGLAVLAKWIFAMIVPCLVVLWLADRFYFHKLKHRHFIIPMLVMLAAVLSWFGYMTLTLGVEGVSDILSQTQDNATSNVFFLSLESILRGVKFLVQSHFLVWGLPGIVYTLLLNMQRRNRAEPKQWFLLVFVGGWLVWYVFFSLGWSRQAFAPLALGHIFLAKLLHDLANGFALSVKELAAGIREGNTAVFRKLSVGLTLLALLLSSPTQIAKGIMGEQDASAQEFATYINEHVPQDTVIESYEYELDILTDHIYHHPPETLVTLATKHVYSGEPYPPGFYDLQAFHPQYLILGPFAKWTSIYHQEFQDQRWALVKSVGEYDLFRININEEKW
jgi:4-amino-4-deoxy-L-arabinose transferase-like glycosyltransferase